MTWSSSPTPNTSRPGAASSRTSSTWAGVRSWNSSTSRWRQRGLGPAAELAVGAAAARPRRRSARRSRWRPWRRAARGTGRRRRRGRGRRPARPRPRPGRAGRAGRARAPRGRGRAGRCWPGGGRAGTSSSTSRRTSRSSSTCGSAAPGLGQQRVAERVERLHPGLEVRGAGLHLLLGLLVVGDGQERLPLEPAVDDQVAQALGEHPGLARSRRRDDPGRAGAVGDGGQLVGSEVGGRGHVGGDERQAPELDRVGVHDAGAVHDTERRPRAAVDPRRPAVGQHDVGRAVRGAVGAQPLGLAGPPPDRLAVAGVVGVGPDEEVQPVDPRLEPRPERPRRVVPGRGGTERSRIDRQRHDDGFARRPGPVQLAHHLGGLGQGRLVDPHHGRAPPRLRHGPAVAHHDPAPERGRTRDGHARTVRTRCANARPNARPSAHPPPRPSRRPPRPAGRP